MNKFALIAAAGVAVAAGAASAQTVELRIVGGEAGGTLSDFANTADTSMDLGDWTGSKTFYVQARVIGDGGFQASNITISADGAVGTFAASALSLDDAAGFFVEDAVDPNGRAGLLPNFRAILEPDAAGNDDLANGQDTPAGWLVLALSTSPTGVVAQDWVDVYKFDFTASDADGFSLNLSTEAGISGVATSTGIIEAPTATEGYTVVPAPGTVAMAGLGGLVAIRRRR